MNITLRQLRYLLALADQGHFGRAAELVHVTQPALSMQIKALEAETGATLVERTPQGAVLTAEGRTIAAHARRVLDEVAALEQTARRPGRGGRLRLGMIPTVAPYLLPEVLPDLRSRDISRDLDLREALTEPLLAELAAGQLDAAVVASQPEDPALAATPLLADPFLLAGSAARIAALAGQGESLRPRALDPGQLLLLDEGHCLGDQALALCGLARRPGRLHLGAASLATLCRLAAQGMGLTFLPGIAVAQELAAAPGLAVTRLAPPEPVRQLMLARRVSTPDGGWFADLALLLTEGGDRLLAAAR